VPLPKAASNAAPRIRSDRSRSVTLLLLRPMRASLRSDIHPPLILMRFEAKRAKYLAIRRVSPEESLSATVAKIYATDKSSQRFYADGTFGGLGQGCFPPAVFGAPRYSPDSSLASHPAHERDLLVRQQWSRDGGGRSRGTQISFVSVRGSSIARSLRG